MDFSNLIDAVILLVCGALVALYGSGIICAKVAGDDSAGREKMRVVVVIGVIIILAGLIQLVRGFLSV